MERTHARTAYEEVRNGRTTHGSDRSSIGQRGVAAKRAERHRGRPWHLGHGCPDRVDGSGTPVVRLHLRLWRRWQCGILRSPLPTAASWDTRLDVVHARHGNLRLSLRASLLRLIPYLRPESCSGCGEARRLASLQPARSARPWAPKPDSPLK